MKNQTIRPIFHLFAGAALVICSASANAQVSESAAEAAAKKEKVKGYGGGGIRGAVGSLPVDANRWLVLPDEALAFEGEKGFNEAPALRPRAVIPAIELLAPEMPADGKIKSPFPIRVNFRGMSDAAIDPSSFRVFYGALKIDITSRLTGHVAVTADGFTLDQAKIPKGRHRLTLQIQDIKQRMAERELRIEVD